MTGTANDAMTEAANNEIDRLAQRYAKSRRGLRASEKLRLVNAVVRATEKHTGATIQRKAPEGYLTLLEVQNSLIRGIWAGIGRAELAAETARKADATGKSRLGFGPRHDRVQAVLKKACLSGKLKLYVAVDDSRCDKRLRAVPAWPKKPVPLPENLLEHVFITVDGRMPANFAIRPRREAVGSDRMFALLQCGQIVLRESEFRRWLKPERRKRKWPSQRALANVRRGVGRPRKQAIRLKILILGLAREGAWDGRRPLMELHRMLAEKMESLPSVDTIGRVVDEAFAETGAPELRRRRRIRRK
jgi:hypothetical protein